MTTVRRTRRAWRSIAMVGATTMVLAACAGDGSSDEGSSDEETAANGGDESSEDETASESSVDFPTRDVSVVIPYAAGGGTDTTVRPFAQALEQELGQSVIVENRAGGAGVVGINDVYRADPDGHMIGAPIDSILTVQPQTNPDVEFDHTSFKSVQFVEAPMLIVTRDDAPWDDLGEFLDDAEEQPGELTYGIPGIATDNDLNGRALMQAADVELEPVPFAGGGADSLAALLRGDVDTSAIIYSTVRGQVEAGELKVLGVLSDQPLEPLPDVPTLTDLGLESEFFRGVGISLVVPNDTPDEVVDVIASSTEAAVENEDLTNTWAEQGAIVRFRDVEETAEYHRGLSDSLAELFDIYPDLAGNA